MLQANLQEGEEFQNPSEIQIVDDAEEESIGIDEYSISSYGLDFDVEGIIRRYRRGDIVIPEFQRRYVWTKPQASRFIESLLLGLPVPGIFLYREVDTRQLTVIDGQQRILTLNFYYNDVFREESSFQLRGLESRFNEMSYKDLSHEDRRKLDDSIIHATIVRQERPEENSNSKYSIFERLNTGGTRLSPQEIRTSIYPGEFCDLLTELNEHGAWRSLFGNPHRRKRDEELILRFFALFFDSENYFRPMAKFLNQFMNQNRRLRKLNRDEMSKLFQNTTGTILDRIGEGAFKPQKALNAAVLDSIMVGVAMRLRESEIQNSLVSHYQSLLDNPEFDSSVSESTSQGDKVRLRIKLAKEAFANAT